MELQSLLKHLDSPQQVHSTNFAFTSYHSSVANHHIAVVSPIQMGNVDAATLTQQAISEFQPKNIIVMGIAAGISDKVSLGDVIVASSTAYYEIAKQRSRNIQPRPRFESVDATLLDIAQNIREVEWVGNIKVNLPESDGNTSQLKSGLILSGEKVVDNSARVKELLKQFPTAIGIDMESYGVAHAISTNQIKPRLIIIRGVSDHATNKSDMWQSYAAAAAAAFTHHFIQKELSNGRDSEYVGIPPNPIILVRHESTNAVSPEHLQASLPDRVKKSILGEVHINQLNNFPDHTLLPTSDILEAQTDLRQQVDKWRNSASNLEVIYYGLPHVPLAFLAGHQLEKLPIDFYEVDRYKPSEFWHVEKESSPVPELIEEEPNLEQVNDVGDVLVRISVSYEVALSDLVNFPHSFIGAAHLRLKNIGVDAVRTTSQLQDYSMRFRHLLDKLYLTYPNLASIHIMYAGPVALAFSFGQQISPRMDAPIFVYSYNSKALPLYNWAIQITGLDSPQYHPAEN